MTTRYGFVSTYPPTQCGLATFTAALAAEVARPDDAESRVVRLVETTETRASRTVVAQIVQGHEPSLRNGVAALNACDVAIVQHEYGIYGGADGDEILPLLDGLDVPTIVVLHTVPREPTPRQRSVLEAIIARADWCVTMSVTARDRLVHGYAVDPTRLSVIAHGAAVPMAGDPRAMVFRTGRPTVLTWGLLGPGKGIEWAIGAMDLLRDLDPRPRYVVAGQTHPKVALRDGEAYRNGLAEQVRALGLGDCVEIDGRYRESADLARLVRSADVVLLPYDSVDQVTSGVLIEAVAAGRPVVATRFPHAIELLADGAGIVVPHRDPGALAAALREVLGHGERAAAMAAVAARHADELSWTTVAGHYRALADRLIRTGVPA